MPRGTSNDIPHSPRETATGLREMAAGARRLAAGTFDKLSVNKLNEFAEELEARAAALETEPQIVSHDQAAAVQRADPKRDQS